MLVVNIYTKPKIKRFKNIKNEKNNIELFQYINVRLSEPIQNLKKISLNWVPFYIKTMHFVAYVNCPFYHIQYQTITPN